MCGLFGTREYVFAHFSSGESSQPLSPWPALEKKLQGFGQTQGRG